MVVTDKSLGEDMPMCPKHGVAHGVCVDPIKAEKEREPVAAPCVYCGKTGMIYPHYCDNLDAPLDAPPDMEPNPSPPNRFDPYEALDRILVGVEEIAEHPRPHFRDVRINEFGVIRDKVNALRAYITGMGK